jgi:hypothetical protein
MDFMSNIELKKLTEPIRYEDKVLLIGSCFTEHIGNALAEHKFSVLQNPNGILFDPASVCTSLLSYIQCKQYTASELFQLNEVWNSWQHHSRFSHLEQQQCLQQINESQRTAHHFLKEADWIIVTLGSSFSYRLLQAEAATEGVANCHRAPAQWFNKHLLEINETVAMLDNCYYQLMQFNSNLKIIFTVSPVRHLRDGVVDNNRSKARLIEAVHHLVNKFDNLYYFPAYELVIDVLRDYRFYDVDMAHPNYMATTFVLEKFAGTCIAPEAQQLMEEIKKIMIARKHKAFQPTTKAHQQFLASHFQKANQLQTDYPFLNLKEELAYFNSSAETL